MGVRVGVQIRFGLGLGLGSGWGQVGAGARTRAMAWDRVRWRRKPTVPAVDPLLRRCSGSGVRRSFWFCLGLGFG